MDDLVGRVPPVTNPNVGRIEPERFDRNPDRGNRQPRPQQQKEQPKSEPEEAPASSERKMDIRV